MDDTECPTCGQHTYITEGDEQYCPYCETEFWLDDEDES